MSKRNQTLDIFRGLTIAVMIFVNSLPASPKWYWFEHAPWNGCTIADLVFPFFLFIVGFTNVIHGSRSSIGHILKRSMLLMVLGLLLNAFPHFENIRIPGILQRIALCYLVVAFLNRYTRPITQALIMIGILIAYYFYNLYYPTTYWAHLLPGQRWNHIGYVDQVVFTSKHLLYPYFDPEGLVGTIPSIASTLFGALMGYLYLKSPKYFNRFLIIIGGIAFAIAYFWQPWCPLNKRIWSSSFVLWSSAIACWTFAALSLFNTERLAPLSWAGQHSLNLFIAHVVGLKLLYAIKFESHVSLAQFILNKIQLLFSPQTSSLLFAGIYTLLWFLPWLNQKINSST